MRLGAVLDSDGLIVNMIVLPATDDELGPAWTTGARARIRPLTDAEKTQGVGIGWRRSNNGRFVDAR